jgi:phosphoglucosamine mutase
MTTPGAAFLCGRFGFDAAVVISASHNPFNDNGIKIFLPDGRKLDADGEAAIENSLNEPYIPYVGRSMIDDSRVGEFKAAYEDHLRSNLKMSASGLRLVIDCANGAASAIAPAVFRSSGAEVITINDSPNGRNINLNCGSTHIDALRAAVIAQKADLGIAYDGDADRSLFVDENGDILDGDGTLLVLARQLRRSGGLKNSTVVATVMSNFGLDAAFKAENIKLERTAVGDKYVLDRLLSTGSELGGEQSGHIILPKRSLIGDGIMTSILLLEAMLEENSKASELCRGFTRFPQTLRSVKVKKKVPFDDLSAVKDVVAAIEKRLEGNGRLLLRYSGTEPLARVMIEGLDRMEIEKMAEQLIGAIQKELG